MLLSVPAWRRWKEIYTDKNVRIKLIFKFVWYHMYVCINIKSYVISYVISYTVLVSYQISYISYVLYHISYIIYHIIYIIMYIYIYILSYVISYIYTYYTLYMYICIIIYCHIIYTYIIYIHTIHIKVFWTPFSRYPQQNITSMAFIWISLHIFCTKTIPKTPATTPRVCQGPRVYSTWVGW